MQRGGVSIFIVIFTSLMITVVTTSFVQLMVQNQQQASNNDLSQSAYDAALAGVEDAKRLLVKLDNCERANDAAGDACVTDVMKSIRALDGRDECHTTDRVASKDPTTGEFIVGDPSLNQAYTCVKIDLNTPSVGATLRANEGSKTFRLKADQPFDQIKVSWFSQNDLKVLNGNESVEPEKIEDPQLPTSLPQDADWDDNDFAPPILRTQLVQFKNKNLNLSEFKAEGSPNSRTVFLYPQLGSIDTGAKDYLSVSDNRLGGTSADNNPKVVTCDRNAVEYLCSVLLNIPNQTAGGEREAYLQLAALYNQTSFKIELRDSSAPVGSNEIKFSNVQPTVDSTGRASSLFRRVKAQVSIREIPLPPPDAALYVNGDVCKSSFVTDRKTDFRTDC